MGGSDHGSSRGDEEPDPEEGEGCCRGARAGRRWPAVRHEPEIAIEPLTEEPSQEADPQANSGEPTQYIARDYHPWR